jgi:transposase InsO family protein
MRVWRPVSLRDGLLFHRDNNPAWFSARQTLAGLTATTSASTIMNVRWCKKHRCASADAVAAAARDQCGTFYYLCSILDGFSRFLVHWDLRESMREADVEEILERAKEKYPEAKPRIISDNGSQFIARDFKESFAYS